MIYFYLVLSVALIPVLNNFFDILKQEYSWWLVPVLFFAFFIGFILLHFIIFILCFAVTSTKTSQDKGAKFYRFLLRITLPLIISVARVKINVSGMNIEEVPLDREMLFVCNHQHDFDPAVIFKVFLNHDIGFIGKKEIYKTMPLIGKIMHRLYCLPIDRENDREAAKTIIEAIRIIKAKKASIAVFPEGYTSKTCELLPFRNGSFKIAMKAKAPIVVCALWGTREIPKRLILRKSEVNFKIIDVIYPEQFENLNTQELGDMIHKQMEDALMEIKKEEN